QGRGAAHQEDRQRTRVRSHDLARLRADPPAEGTARAVRGQSRAGDGAPGRDGQDLARGHRGRAEAARRAPGEERRRQDQMIRALIDHLWQSTLFGAAIWSITLALRANSAAVRHGLWLLASIKFLVPFSALYLAGAAAGLATP